jgi:hypothetical protein
VIGRRLLFVCVLGTGALVIASFASLERAAAADPPARLEAVAEQDDDGVWMLRATLTRAGVVQSGRTVEFLQQVDFFGERWVPLGTAVTDAAGSASLPYSPTWNGVQHLVARYEADDGRYESLPVEITVSGAIPAIPEEAPVLPIMRVWAFPVATVVLILVWLALAGILLGAVVGIARSGPDRATAELPLRQAD